MIKIIMSGCNGAMGRVITKLASEDDNIQIVAGFDIFENADSKYPVYNNPESCDVDADVIIDFSHPDFFDKVTNFACLRKIPIVLATTGLSKQQISKLNQISQGIPVFFSANMSLGINLLIELAECATKVLQHDFDIEIIEKHHNKKIDAPSGTALAIADAISETLTQNAEYVYDRHSVRKKRNKNEIGIHAVRGGTITGDHTVIFAGNDEIIEISHQAASKDVFASGAISAAKFLFDKEPAMYNMKNLVQNI